MTETLRLASRLAVRAPDGVAVELHDVRVRLERQGDAFGEVRLLADVPAGGWAAIDAAALFHLAPEARGACFGGPFDPSRPVHLELRLEAGLATALAVLATDEWTLLAELLGARLLKKLHDTESWWALTATQQRGRVRGGFRTTHA